MTCSDITSSTGNLCLLLDEQFHSSLYAILTYRAHKVWLHTTLLPVGHKIPKVLCSGGCCFSWPPLLQFPSSFFRAVIFTFAYILATDNKVVTDHVIISKDIAQLKNNYIQLYIGATFSLKTLNSPQLRTPAIKQHFSEEQQIS